MPVTKILPELTNISITEFNTSLILSSSSGSLNECTLTSTSVLPCEPLVYMKCFVSLLVPIVLVYHIYYVIMIFTLRYI